MALPYLFEFWAMPHQLPPGGDWRTWVILGGRGAGKTRAGAEWVRSEVEGAKPLDAGRSARVALVGETIEQVREVMVFGESGILACSPPDRRPDWQATRKRLVWPNGAVAQVFSAHEPESLRGPQFDAAWVDEYGCAAIDKGANQPNRFHDPKSSESGLPHYSDGTRDDLMQHVFLVAMQEYWADETNNPLSDYSGVQMVDLQRSCVWSWDVRPYPHFPINCDLWSDGANYARGHWLNGRAGGRTLASTVRDICIRSGVTEIDTNDLQGYVRGYTIEGSGTARSALQPLMLAFGFDAADRGGVMKFTNRDGYHDVILNNDHLAVWEEQTGLVESTRAPAAELAGRVRLNFVEAGADYAIRSAEAILPDEVSYSVSSSEIPMALTPAEGREIVDRWLAEARVARDQVSFNLPLSSLSIGAGDVVWLATEESATSLYRIDRAELSSSLHLEATRVEPGVYLPGDQLEEELSVQTFTPAVPVLSIFMDLPIIRETEAPHAPFVALAAEPWPGRVAVYSSSVDADYGLNTLAEQGATIGITKSDLQRAPAGLRDSGPALRVQLSSGALSSVDWESVLNGANLAAIGDGSADGWEILQFQAANLVGPGSYDLFGRLRGQLGTDGLMPDIWPEGSLFVLLNSAPVQLQMPLSARGLARHYRIGPAARPLDDPAYSYATAAFDGAGLRPYAPVHLRALSDESGGFGFSWVRRTRIDGDSWTSFEVPLGEHSELYKIAVLDENSVTVRENVISTPEWHYPSSQIQADGVAGPFAVEVRQISQSYGVGPAARLMVSV